MITVLLFAQLQEQLQKDKLPLEMDRVSVRELKEYLKEEFGLVRVTEAMVAINEAYALEDDEIKSGDIVAIIPPVSGG
ncbi:molybdopterin converting factor subunit 1 [Gracilibacillus marinus]|uniref:Molybdopterin synthase sulfur carrier subunit n=1 Tax=Gracilibacillus marinus TaxID=630535 RepID=A0ABV8VVQ1_9BACI